MISKQQIISTLMLSPYYFSLTLDERRLVIEDLAVRYGPGYMSLPGRDRNRKDRPPSNPETILKA